MQAQSSRRRYAMASSLPAQRDCSISSTAEAFFPNRSGSLPRLATSMAFAPVLDANGDDLAAVNQAFMCACHLQHATAAALLLERSITLDAELGRQIDGGPGRSAFVQYIMAESETLAFTNADPAGPWQAFVMQQVVRAVNDGDLTSFVGELRGEAWMLADACVKFQVGLIERAVLRDREAFITALLHLDPLCCVVACRRHRRPLSSRSRMRRPVLLPTLLRIWRLPDDLPHAAGNGDFARREKLVRRGGQACTGRPGESFSRNSAHTREPEWGEPSVQHVLDTALAWAVLNNHFEIAGLSSRSRGRYQHDLGLP